VPAKRSTKKNSGVAAEVAPLPPTPELATVENRKYVVGDEIYLGPDDKKTLESSADPLAAAHAAYGQFMDQYESVIASLDAQKRQLRGNVLAAKASYEAAIKAVGKKYGAKFGDGSKEAWAYNGHGVLKRTG